MVPEPQRAAVRRMRMKTHVIATFAAVALGTLTACSGDDATTAEDPASTPSESPSSPSGSPGPGSYPELAAEDYTYTLEIMCFCPLAGPAQVTVEDGEAVEAVATRKSRGTRAGDQAPEFYLVTINDIITDANDPEADEVEVVWPEGQEWPSKVSIDRDERMVDEEVTYTIRDVVEAAG
ncbi:MAG TPA: DUF6174 domain-containing protein [Nocardioides sp.]|nr:DUF6174 domain-containing protein [Nocardioides sp.]